MIDLLTKTTQSAMTDSSGMGDRETLVQETKGKKHNINQPEMTSTTFVQTSSSNTPVSPVKFYKLGQQLN